MLLLLRVNNLGFIIMSTLFIYFMIKSCNYLNYINNILLYEYNVAYTLFTLQYISIHFTHKSHILTFPPQTKLF